MLSDEYHAPFVQGGHVRIYSASELKSKMCSVGLALRGTHRAHSLHSPYWWLRCAVGPTRQDSRLVNSYKRFLEWDIVTAPRTTRILDKALSPVLGKSYVVYSQKPITVKATGDRNV